MKYFRIKYNDGNFKIVRGENSSEIIEKYDLYSKENINTYLVELEGEQLAIAIDNDQDDDGNLIY